MNYQLPPDDISLNCKEILNEAPDMIAKYQEELGKCITNLSRLKASIALDNRGEKQAILKAIVDTDEGVIAMANEVTRLQVHYDLWKNAQSAARAFHKEQTQG